MMKRLLPVCLLAAAFAAAALPAYADRDAVQFGSNIHVEHNSSVHDAVCFFCSVNAEGEVDGDIVVFFGNVHVAGAAHHDVVNFFGSVTVDDNGSVGQDLVSMFGGVRLGQNVSVGKDLVAMFGTMQASDSVTVGNDRVVQPGWVLYLPLFIIAFIVFVVVREYRSYHRRLLLRGYPMPPPR
jgi:hypothetical protein